MSGFMNTLIVGFAGNDPELRYLDSGIAVCSVNIAVDQPSSRDDRKTAWVRVTFWRDQAESLASNVSKGTPIAVGANFIEARHYTNNAGAIVDTLEAQGTFWRFTGRKSDNPAASGGSSEPAPSDEVPF